MSKGFPRQSLHERVAAAILDAAARALAEAGEEASMADVAAEAGVARATVYRYFPNRDALLEELTHVALEQAAERLAGAGLDRVPVAEGVARSVRALYDVGDYLVVLARERVRAQAEAVEQRIALPLRELLERGLAEGTIRSDIPAPWLAEALVGLVVTGLRASPPLGTEDTIAAVSSLFLHGAGLAGGEAAAAAG